MVRAQWSRADTRRQMLLEALVFADSLKKT